MVIDIQISVMKYTDGYKRNIQVNEATHLAVILQFSIIIIITISRYGSLGSLLLSRS